VAEIASSQNCIPFSSSICIRVVTAGICHTSHALPSPCTVLLEFRPLPLFAILQTPSFLQLVVKFQPGSDDFIFEPGWYNLLL
jgi:hypothetical protein